MEHPTATTQEIRVFYDGVFAAGEIRDNELLYHWIVRLLRPRRGARLLDVACGSGWLLHAAARAGLQTAGLDISPKAVEKARAFVPGAEVVAGDGEHLPWPDASFDYVTCLGSLEHYLHPDQGVREIARVMKPGGAAAVMLPNSYPFADLLKLAFSGRVEEPDWQIVERHAAREEWRRFLEANGLRVTAVHRYNKYPELFTPGTPWKIKSLRKFFTRAFIRYLAPFNLAQQFVYLCERAPAAAAATNGSGVPDQVYKVESNSQLAEAYDEVYQKRPVHRADPHYRWILSLIRPKRGDRLADLACGAGFLLQEASRDGVACAGIDLSPEGVKLARRHAPAAEVTLGDGENLPWPDASYDFVTCLGSLEHYLHPDRGVREMARVAKPGGTVCIMLPNRYSWYIVRRVIRNGEPPGEQAGFERLNTAAGWRRLIEENGLRVRRVVPQNEIKHLVDRERGRLKSVGKWLDSRLVRALCPFHMAYHFVFLCERAGAPGK